MWFSKFSMQQNHTQGWLVKTQIAGLIFRVSGLVTLEWGLQIFISNFPWLCYDYWSQVYTSESLKKRKDIVKERKRRGLRNKVWVCQHSEILRKIWEGPLETRSNLEHSDIEAKRECLRKKVVCWVKTGKWLTQVKMAMKNLISRDLDSRITNK